MTEPRVGVLMPAFNHEKYVVEAVESIFSIPYDNLVLAVCDDHSADRTYELLSQLRERRPFILLRNEKQQGINRTLNRLKAAVPDADIYALLASDDMFDPEGFSEAIDLMRRNQGIDMLLSLHTVINSSGEKIGVSSIRPKNLNCRVTLQSPFDDYLGTYQIQRARLTNALYPLPENLIGEDSYSFSYAFLKGYEIYQSDIHLVYRRIHGANISTSALITTSTEQAIERFKNEKGYRRLKKVGVRRHMLVSLGLANDQKRRFISHFASDWYSPYYWLFLLSFITPIRLAFDKAKRIYSNRKTSK